MSRFKQDTIRTIYGVWARLYRWLTPVYLLGNEGHLRRRSIRALRLEPGQVVSDVGWGTGRSFPYMMMAIGAQGFLLGVGYTPAMLQEAKRLVHERGWDNVELIQGDSTTLPLKSEVDAALSTLAMSVIPDYQRALQQMVKAVRPGGRVAISGAKRSEQRYARPFNFVADCFGWLAAADVSRRPWTLMAELVEDYTLEPFFLDLFHVAAGTVPGVES